MKNIKEIYYTNPDKPSEKRLVARIDRSKKGIEYFIGKDFSGKDFPQRQWIKTIIIIGFGSKRLPAGFSKKGIGLGRKTGYLILRDLYEKLGEFDFFVSLKVNKSVIRKIGGKYRVTMNYFDLRDILTTLNDIKRQGYETLETAANNTLNKLFPKYFKKSKEVSGLVYQGNQLDRILKREGVIENLSGADIRTLIDFFPLFVKHVGDRFKGKKLLGILKNKIAAEIVYLENIVKEFERKMKAKTQNEQRWQKFFQNYIQIFNSNYATVFEKKNLSLSGDFPDFIPIDIYGYLDIYEIKKPNTKLLALDRSRKNYYWSSDLSKAISQVENYIDSATRYAPALREEIKKRDGVDIRVVRPRGFIITSNRGQLKGEIMENNFRILNNSLKNIEIILYDDILNNLKSFLKKVKDVEKKK